MSVDRGLERCAAMLKSLLEEEPEEGITTDPPFHGLKEVVSVWWISSTGEGEEASGD